ncbi:pimeloyl-ACP methyl ester carboxylesterase [Kineococcus radiotolerans]|uniref:Pimeloyl-ACP methyl ester carboxylesterase n=1 Tax=Kineococcus radiotolerans TaxID=131568 RepID=A0A7W4TR23_KINRA|nr:alpha/beta hydrolase [Kineococcus radiotolerans]MBB2903370.1 pimeloyl-ACP methyl ester carboxylesterase [Kineococcus radiotolerans]
MSYLADTVDTSYVDVGSARFAYRRFGAGTDTSSSTATASEAASAAGSTTGQPPLVLLQRFRGTINHWDPAFLDALATQREVIVFDNRGIGFTSGQTPTTFAEMAHDAAAFIDALGLAQVDLLGWSIGGFVAQLLTLQRPELVRRLLVLGSGPGGSTGAPGPDDKVIEVMTHPESNDEDFLFLFFGLHDEGRRLGLESLRRLDTRLSASGVEVSQASWQAQLQAIGHWSSADEVTAWPHLSSIKVPVLVANGAHDVMVHAQQSYAMSQHLPDATVLLYSDAGHAFLFQRPQEFAAVVLDFLAKE